MAAHDQSHHWHTQYLIGHASPVVEDKAKWLLMTNRITGTPVT